MARVCRGSALIFSIFLLLGTAVFSSRGTTTVTRSQSYLAPYSYKATGQPQYVLPRNDFYESEEESEGFGQGIMNFLSDPVDYVTSTLSNAFGFSSRQDRPPQLITVSRPPRYPVRNIGLQGPQQMFVPGPGPFRRPPPTMYSPHFQRTMHFSPRFPRNKRRRFPEKKRSTEIKKGHWTGGYRSHFKMIDSNDDGFSPIIHAEELKDENLFHHNNEIHSISQPSKPKLIFPLETINTLESSPQPTVVTFSHSDSPQFQADQKHVNQVQTSKKWEEWGQLVGKTDTNVAKREIGSSFKGTNRAELKEEVKGRLHKVTDVMDALKIVVDALQHADSDNVYVSKDGQPVDAIDRSSYTNYDRNSLHTSSYSKLARAP